MSTKENNGFKHPWKVTHGESCAGSNTPEYGAWNAMKDRCINPNNKKYKIYGGAGVKVCKRWLESYENFLKDMGRRPSPKHSLDRWPNKKGNYTPKNCRWATIVQQNRNRSTSKSLTYKGETKNMAQWCEDLGLKYRLIMLRIYNGWTTERAFETPAVRPDIPILKFSMSGEFICEYKNLSEAYKQMGINRKNVNISAALNGRSKTAGGYGWKYK